MKQELAIGVGLSLIIFAIYLGYNVLPILGFLGIGALVLFSFLRAGGAQGGLRISKVTTVPKISFEDIGGQGMAKQELVESLQLIKKDTKSTALGIRPLKGILLYGPPGTGKTLLAKATAHQCDAAFVATSGSEFVEMYAGVGAKRIRTLFKNVKERAKKENRQTAVVFIDELEIIAGKRGRNSSHMEYDQTLNQLLVELDGINVDESVRVLVIGATNRKDILDSALLRPGRFDRLVEVDLPDKIGRLEIIKVHTKNKPLDKTVSLEKIAEATYGFSGAHLESVCNEAAISALREDEDFINEKHLSDAIDKVLLGEKVDRKSDPKERKRIGVHEAGHALVCEIYKPGQVDTVKLANRGKALGYMRQNDVSEQLLYTKEQLLEQINILLGGCAAESVIYGGYSTGASNDFEKACSIAEKLIASGLSDIGVIPINKLDKDKLAQEISKIVNKQLSITINTIIKEKSKLERLVSELLIEETVEGKRIRELLASA